MKNDENAHGDDYQGDNAATGEYPVLFDAVGEPAGPLPAQNGAAHDVTVESPRLPTGEEAQVSGWLADLEAEIARLHDRWQQVEQGFSARDSLIAGMKQEIATRDSTLAELHARLERNAETLKSLERSLADKTAEAAHLSAEVAGRVAAHEQDAAALAAAAAARQVMQRDLDAARADIARLNGDVTREQAAVKSLASRNEQLMAAQATMTLRIQELEAYIDGRAQSWSGLNQEIAEQKSTIARLEKGLKTKDAAIEDALRSRRELDQKLAELERLNLELTGRRKEREDAYEELQRKLAGHFALAEQLKADLAMRAGEHDRLLASATADRTLIATLETAVRDRDAALDSLRAELAADRAAADERLSAIERALAERDAALAQSREQAEQQTALAAKLAAELDVKRTSVDLLQRNVQRITSLGASLAELERRIESSRTAGAMDGESAASAGEATPAAEEAPAELLPLESFMAPNGGGDAAPSFGDRAPKLVGSIGGEAVAFPLGKSETTIGRGKGSDIRISSHFISRLHAKISKRGIATTIEDVGSRNGIFVNSNRIRRCVLRDGDVVSLASELELTFVDAVH